MHPRGIAFAYLLVPFLVLLNLTESARILGVFNIPSYSHQIVFQPIWKELSLRGHEVTVIASDTLDDVSLSNLTEINVKYLYNHLGFVKELVNAPSTNLLRELMKATDDLTENILRDPEVQKIYKDPTREFDLVIAEALSPSVYSFAGRFNASLVGALSMSGMLFNHFSIGNPVHPALYGDMFTPIRKQMTMWEKMYLTYYIIYERFHFHFEVIPRGNRIAKKYFGELLPYSIEEINKNMSLLLLNSNTILNPIRPSVPAVVQMGFMHIKPVKPLPADLQKIMDSSSQGVVYFSLGTNVKTLANTIISDIVGALGELPYTVLWKRHADNITGLPKNIITRKWYPQQDILAHPNVKVFVTQCGFQSTEEALSRGVPMVAIPFIADQNMNMQRVVDLGIAVDMTPTHLTKETLKKAIIEVAENKKYKENILKLKAIVDDQPATSLDRSIWWIEYVLRHKGASHLRSNKIDIPLYEYLLLDVICVVLVLLGFMIFVTTRIVKFILNNVSIKKLKQA